MSAGRGIPLDLLLDMLRDANTAEGLGVGVEHLLEHPHTATYRRLIEQAWHGATADIDELREEITRLRTAQPLPDEQRPAPAGPACLCRPDRNEYCESLACVGGGR